MVHRFREPLEEEEVALVTAVVAAVGPLSNSTVEIW